MPLTTPIRLRLGRSYWLSAVLVATHAIAIVALMISAVPWWLRVMLALPVLLSAYGSLIEHGLRNAPQAIDVIHLNQQNCWLQLIDGRHTTATIETIGCCHPWVVTLRLLLADGKRRRLIIPGDAIAADSHRRLRQLLRNMQILSDDGDPQ